jgi:pimeloyl-ACP methyl ester carboxylesterase
MEHYTHAGLTFEVTDRGAGDPVLMLHGFPSDRAAWDGVGGAVVAAGYRMLAPEQRGYSPAARPRSRADYRVDRLGADVVALAEPLAWAGFTSWATIGARRWRGTWRGPIPIGWRA